MKKSLKVEGMHCGGCSGRLKRTLEALPGVQEAVADHVGGTAVVTLKDDVSDEALKTTIESAGFKVLGCELLSA